MTCYHDNKFPFLNIFTIEMDKILQTHMLYIPEKLRRIKFILIYNKILLLILTI